MIDPAKRLAALDYKGPILPPIGPGDFPGYPGFGGPLVDPPAGAGAAAGAGPPAGGPPTPDQAGAGAQNVVWPFDGITSGLSRWWQQQGPNVGFYALMVVLLLIGVVMLFTASSVGQAVTGGARGAVLGRAGAIGRGLVNRPKKEAAATT